MTDPILRLDGIGLSFRLHYERSDTLKETLLKVLRHKHGYRDLLALSDISFTVQPGESIGIIGRNGSGKSSLLKIIAGVYEPSMGKCQVNGSVAALIELGAGFHGELTGRENVFLNGAIMRLSRAQIASRYEGIVDFAELHDFMDVPVKNYSSGMYARLGFAIATCVDGDVLLVDEVLSVGDEAFKRKCKARMANLLTQQKTIIYVSHEAESVRQICHRAIVLHHGKLHFDGPVDDALACYREIIAEDTKPALAIC